jgi:hypothetical protein
MPCDASGEDAYVGDEDSSRGTCDGFLPVLGQPPTAAEPGEGAFNHPAAREQFEALALSERLTICSFQSPMRASAPRGLLPAEPPSAT